MKRQSDERLMTENEFISTFQKYMEAFFKNNKFKKSEIAKNMDICSSTLRNYRNSNRTPRLYSVYRFSYYYNADLYEMFGLKRPDGNQSRLTAKEDSFINGYRRLNEEEKKIVRAIVFQLNKKKTTV